MSMRSGKSIRGVISSFGTDRKRLLSMVVKHESHGLHPIESTILNHIRQTNCIMPKEHVLLSVSGGVDSMAMLHILQVIKPILDVNLSVVSFNHKMREISEIEVDFVKSWAIKYNLPFYERTAEQEVSRWQIGMQEKARAWRHQQYLDIITAGRSSNVSETSDVVVATAHQADDQVETMLMKLLRGVHISRLYASVPRTSIKVQDSGRISDLILARPLLTVPKSDLIGYMQERQLTWYEDVSNSDSEAYKRNAIRLELVPMLSKVINNDSELLRKRFLTLAEQACELDSGESAMARNFISSHVRETFKVQRQPWLSRRGPDPASSKWWQTRTAYFACGRQSAFAHTPSFLRTRILLEILNDLLLYESSSPLLIPSDTDRTFSYETLKTVLALAEKPLVEDANGTGESLAISLGNLCRARLVGETMLLEVCNALMSDAYCDIQDSNRHNDGDSGEGYPILEFSPVRSNSYIIANTPYLFMRQGFRVDFYSLLERQSDSKIECSSKIMSDNGIYSLNLFGLPKDCRLSVRYPVEGDTFSSRPGKKSPLTAVLREKRVPSHLRQFVPVVVMTTSKGSTVIAAGMLVSGSYRKNYSENLGSFCDLQLTITVKKY